MACAIYVTLKLYWRVANVSLLSLSIFDCDLDSVNKFKYLGIMLASDFTWSDHIKYVISKVNQGLGLLPLAYYSITVLFFRFDYDHLVWGDKNNVTLTNDLQVLQNKAAKIILHRPLYPSATDALVTLRWLNLEQRRFYHRCIYVYKCINGLMDHSINLLTNRDIHSNCDIQVNLQKHGLYILCLFW